MQHFKQYITEANISSANFSKAVNLLVKLLKKKTGKTFYRYGGPDGFVENKIGTGILFFYDKFKAVRFNHDGKNFSSITLWKHFKLGQNGDFSIDLGELNIVSAASSIVDVILDAKVGVKELYVESVENLQEASRISPDEFYALVNDELFPGENIGAISWDRMIVIAKKHDRLIPTVVRSTGFGKGPQKLYNLTKLLSVKDHEKPATSVEPIYYIKVTSQDPISKKFMSAKGDANAANILNTIQQAIDNPQPAQIKTMAKDANTLFGHMHSLVQVVARGKRNSLVITGGAGIGKSYTVFETLKEEGLVKDKDWYLIKGKITTSTLYQTLFMHRKGKLLVFDDTDSIWGDGDASNILKAALDSYDEREISWYSGRTVNISKMPAEEKQTFYDNIDRKIDEDPTDSKIKFPSMFDYNGRIIFISNLQANKLDAAVLNRSTKIDMDLTVEEIFARIDSILEKIGSKEVPIDAKREIFQFIKDHHASGKIEAPSIRTFVGAEDLYRSGLPNWRDLMEYV